MIVQVRVAAKAHKIPACTPPARARRPPGLGQVGVPAGRGTCSLSLLKVANSATLSAQHDHDGPSDSARESGAGTAQ